jgi:hypothetical protein
VRYWNLLNIRIPPCRCSSVPWSKKRREEKEFEVDFFSTSLVAVFMKAFSSPPEFSVGIANGMQILVCICPYHSPFAYCASKTLYASNLQKI